jgi:transposase
VTRPALRFIGVRTLENQAALMHHKAREMLVAQRTQLIIEKLASPVRPP